MKIDPRFSLRRCPGASSRRQGGAATLAVVMLLFFVMALVAAYTSRNMVFEQRISTNQLRSTQAIEAAQAGLEWATSLLNAGRVTDTCQPSVDPAQLTFRQRYLNIDPTTGLVAPLGITPTPAPPASAELRPSCVFDGAAWQCSCPSNGAPNLAAPAGSAVFPAFRIRFVSVPGIVGVVRVEVNGCTRLDNACLDFPAEAVMSEGRASISAMVALKSALATPPAAAVTARGDVSGAMTIHNEQKYLTVQAGGAVSVPASSLFSTPGTPGERSFLAADPALAAAALPGEPRVVGDRMFATSFGMWPATYRDQPGTIRPDCGAGECTAANLSNVALLNPGRMIWVDGDLAVATANDIGSVASPVLIVVTGGITFTAPATIYGAVYGGRSSAAQPTFQVNGVGTIQGALMAEHAVSGTANPIVRYDTDIVRLLQRTHGSFVPVPGSWRDFPALE